MSYEYCPTCASSTGTVCATCGKQRERRRGKYSHEGQGHARCKRRPHGVVPCPSHVAPFIRCDFCGVREPMRADPRSYGGFDMPASWRATYNNAVASHSCSACSTQIDVARDAVGGLDVGVVGERAVENLIAALRRLDVATLEPRSARQIRLDVAAVLIRLEARVDALDRADLAAAEARRADETGVAWGVDLDAIVEP